MASSGSTMCGVTIRRQIPGLSWIVLDTYLSPEKAMRPPWSTM